MLDYRKNISSERESGMVLLGTLLLVIIIAMMGRVIYARGPRLLLQAQRGDEALQTEQAAKSGLSYAACQLRADPTWRGDANRVTVNTPNLYVVEDNGNVIGLLTDSGGNVSQFRLRFNFQDGNPGAEGLDDPAPENQIDSHYISINNLDQTAETVVPRASQSTWSVSDSTTGPYSVPGGTVCVLVEGRTGPGLRQHTSAAANAPPSGRVSTYVAEAYLQVTLKQGTLDAALMGGGDIELNLPPGKGKVRISSVDPAGTPRMRSKGSVQVLSGGSPGDLQITNGEVSRDPLSFPGFVGNILGSASIIDENVGDGQDFYNLDWGDVVTADTDPLSKSAVQIPGGTYVHWDDGSVHYYDLSFQDYRTYMADPANHTDVGVVLSSNLAEVRSADNLSNVSGGISVGAGWSLKKKDLRILNSPGGVTDFSVVPRSGARLQSSDSDHILNSPADSLTPGGMEFQVDQSVVSASGDIFITAKLKGEGGTLTTEGAFTVVIPEAEVKAKNSGLSIYAQDDITLSSYRGGSFGEVKFFGLIYTWSNFIGIAGDSTGAEMGKFDFRGALVAYGAPPTSGSPGSSGKGKVTITAKTVNLDWDKSQLGGLVSPTSSSSTLEQVLFNAY